MISCDMPFKIVVINLLNEAVMQVIYFAVKYWYFCLLCL